MILLRPATLADADLLRAWRNDETMRKNSFHSSIVSKRDHMRWLHASLKNKNRRIYIAEIATRYQPHRDELADVMIVPVGEGRLDFDGATIEFDIEIAPQHRGKGYGAQLVVALIAKAREWKPGIPLIAHVKAFNTPSLRAFLRAGFSMRGERCLRLEMK